MGTRGVRALALAIVIAAAAALTSATAAPAAQKNGPVLFIGDGKIWKVQPNGTKPKRVGNRKALNVGAAPNGKKLAFASGSLYTMTMGGRKVKDLLKRYPVERNLAGAYSPQWAPNGKRIVFVGYNNGALYTVKPNGRGLKRMLGKDRIVGTFADPTYTPNGREILFIDQGRIKAVNANTGRGERTIHAPSSGDFAESFDVAPNGRYIHFYAPYGNWRINIDGSGLTRVSDTFGPSFEQPSFSPDGSEIAAQNLGQIWAINGLTGYLGGQRGLTESRPGNEYYPDWAPAPRRKKK